MSKNRTLEPMWRLVEIPVVDETRCTGCGWCVDVCPTECLESGAPMPWMPRPLDCISCSLCELICPDEALTMRVLD